VPHASPHGGFNRGEMPYPSVLILSEINRDEFQSTQIVVLAHGPGRRLSVIYPDFRFFLSSLLLGSRR
jgi:hypothetical protein